MSGKVTRSIADRLWEKAEVRGPDDCWNWQAARDGKGRYGVFYREGRHVGAHVAAYELAYGPVPAGLHVDHQCNNPACINPAHLKAMSPRENVLRGRSLAALNHRKQACQNGHPFTVQNTRINTRGERVCRACDNAKDRARTAAKKGLTQ